MKPREGGEEEERLRVSENAENRANVARVVFSFTVKRVVERRTWLSGVD